MAVWNPDNLMITQKGQLLLSKLQNGEGQATITKVLTGAGRVAPSSLYTQIAVSQPKQNCVVASKESYDTGSVLGLQVSNKDLTTSYVINQIGVYASHPDMGEILYMIGQCDDNTGDIMPLPSVTPVTMNYGFYVIHSKDANITINVDPAGVVTNQRFDILTSKVNDIATFVGYSDDSKVWGVEWDVTNRKITRLGASVGLVGGADHDGFLPWKRRRCVLDGTTGKVLKYHGEAGYTENGSLGPVMVEQPAFWYKTIPVESVPLTGGLRGRALTKVRYYISDKPRVGFKLHPSFCRGAKEAPRDLIYHSAYEGSIFDVSANTHLLNDEQVADFAADKMTSIAGAKPMSGLTQNLTRANARKLANNRGRGWQQMDFVANCANLLLHLVEYASFDCQTTIGKGVCDKTDDGSTNMSNVTGSTSSLGNVSGKADGTNGLVSISYRGEENLWGNIWKWEDGLNIEAKNMNNVYFASGYYFGPEAPTEGYYVDDVSTHTGNTMYKDCNFSLARSNGYVSKIGYSEECDFAFLAVETSGSTNIPINDYFWQNYTYNGWCVSILGGRWNDGLGCGLGCRHVGDTSSYRFRDVGGRLLFVPKPFADDTPVA